MLSGYMWGGEGNRMVISAPNDSLFIPDTLLISSSGQIHWNPDTIVSGLYLLSKTSGESLLIQLSDNEPVFIDAQYIIFPDHVQLNGSEHSNQFLAIERMSKEWLSEMNRMTSVVDSPGWTPTPAKVENLYEDLDSLKNVFRGRALELSRAPMVRMYALLQTAGNHSLFDPWGDRNLFYRADSMLINKRYLREVEDFANMVGKLRQMEQEFQRFNPDHPFPDMEFVQNEESISIDDFRGSHLYLEFPSPDFTLSRVQLNRLTSLHAAGFEVCFVLNPEDDYNIQRNPLFRYLKLQDYTRMMIPMGKPPVNFIVNDQGIIIARNVWDEQIYEVKNFLLTSAAIEN